MKSVKDVRTTRSAASAELVSNVRGEKATSAPSAVSATTVWITSAYVAEVVPTVRRSAPSAGKNVKPVLTMNFAMSAAFVGIV